jgi:hypothetical protein
MSDMKKELNAELLLPFYVNGTLEEFESQFVEQALAENEDLYQEYSFLKVLHTNVQNDEASSPGELGLKRLQRELKKEQSSHTLLNQGNHQPVVNNRWKMTAMAACLMLVIQTVFYFSVDPDSDVYTAAGGGTPAIENNRYVVSVTFVPSVTEQQIRDLLLETKATIIGGPTALGVYQLSIPKDNEMIMNKFKLSTDLLESFQEE